MIGYASELQNFPDLLRATANELGITPGIVEKDYYVVRALKALATEMGSLFVFKGGTSLTKGWHLLERFSEDIDLLFPRQNADGSRLSISQVDKRLLRAEGVVGNTAGFTLAKEAKFRKAGVYRNSEFTYKPSVQHESLSNTIKLEMGIRGGPEPSKVREIRSYVAEYADRHSHQDMANDLAPFGVTCLDVTRTFLEKLFAVHHYYEESRAANRMRHYYDLYLLAQLPEVQAFVNSSEYRTVYTSVKDYSLQYFPDRHLPANDRFADCGAFQAEGDDFARLEANYKKEHYLIFKEPPPFGKVMQRLKEITRMI